MDIEFTPHTIDETRKNLEEIKMLLLSNLTQEDHQTILDELLRVVSKNA